MISYDNNHGESPITHYDPGGDFIEVKFRHRSAPYRYTYNTTGQHHVEAMKERAKAGEGLATYISRNRDMGFE